MSWFPRVSVVELDTESRRTGKTLHPSPLDCEMFRLNLQASVHVCQLSQISDSAQNKSFGCADPDKVVSQPRWHDYTSTFLLDLYQCFCVLQYHSDLCKLLKNKNIKPHLDFCCCDLDDGGRKKDSVITGSERRPPAAQTNRPFKISEQQTSRGTRADKTPASSVRAKMPLRKRPCVRTDTGLREPDTQRKNVKSCQV